MNILEELKLSKKQNNDKRYDYLCEQFNAVDYAIKLEKYTIELQKENKILKENAEHNDKVVDNVNWENMLLKKENKQLKDNWNKLKEYLFDIRKRGFALQNLANVTKNTEPNIAILIIINKIQELEGSDSNE